MVRAHIPLAARSGEGLTEQVVRFNELEAKKRAKEQLEFRLNQEKQFNRKVELNAELRKIKEDLNYLKNKLGSDEKNKDMMDAIKKFEEELNTIENNIHQTKNQSVQDPLNYGIKLNNRLAHLMVEQAQGDFRPTKQGEEVRGKLTQMVDEELGKLKNIIDNNLYKINQMAKEKGVLFVN
jgi:hypothetical protein